MTSLSYIQVLYDDPRNFDVKARRAACAQPHARCQGPLSPSSMFERSPLSVGVPEKNPCFSSFRFKRSRGQFYCPTETDSAPRVAIDRSLTLPLSVRNIGYSLPILLLRLVGLPHILHDLTVALKPTSMFHLRPENVRTSLTMHHSFPHIACHAIVCGRRLQHVGQGFCANDLHATVPAVSFLRNFIL